MHTTPETFLFSHIPSTLATQAHAFHQSVADSHIYPRDKKYLEGLAESGHLFGARTAKGEIVALCYVVLEGEEWELGGITVAPKFRNSGIAGVLSRLALAHTMVFISPWSSGQSIITHVHEANDLPRPLMTKLGFERSGQTKLPPHIAKLVPSMKRNEKGEVVGDKFTLKPQGLRDLCCWFTAFTGTLSSGDKANIYISSTTLRDLKQALREMASEHAECKSRCAQS
jgi:ribosomal protein S18 acetylase RimI-like enzyme